MYKVSLLAYLAELCFVINGTPAQLQGADAAKTTSTSKQEPLFTAARPPSGEQMVKFALDWNSERAVDGSKPLESNTGILEHNNE